MTVFLQNDDYNDWFIFGIDGIFVNAVVASRDREILNVTRPFVARGSSIKRCYNCMLAEHHCICSVRRTSAEQGFLLFYLLPR
jgi:DTW domain-containing protein YfiP